MKIENAQRAKELLDRLDQLEKWSKSIKKNKPTDLKIINPYGNNLIAIGHNNNEFKNVILGLTKVFESRISEIKSELQTL